MAVDLETERKEVGQEEAGDVVIEVRDQRGNELARQESGESGGNRGKKCHFQRGGRLAYTRSDDTTLKRRPVLDVINSGPPNYGA